MKRYNYPELKITEFDEESVTTSGTGGNTQTQSYSEWSESKGASTKKIGLNEMESITAYMVD